ncbi:MAG: autotransporter-associated beta strand repeat-containing protein, partial [Verrucomicrobiaceae bacterium]|nr:autotransporter-associated beta strand repeat-containing protein [Verrucomicrobiaceae bacterium]
YSGVLANNGAGTGSFVKSGDGELRLGGTSTITGTITVSAGNLQVGVSNAGSVGSGGVTVSTGATMSGTGTILGTIATNHSMGGTLRPGDSGGASMGTFKAQGNLVFTPAASTFMQVASPSSTFDKVQGLTSGGTMTLDGTVKVDFESYTPAAGDSWQIFDWSVLNMSAFNSGTNLRSGFDGVDEGDLDLPDVTLQSLLWDLSSFSSGGILSLVSVPEPSRMVQVLLGIAVLLRRRGRDQPTRCT